MRHRRIKDIVIELTSLLDVVMILIFGVMIQNSKLVEKANSQATDLEEENSSLSAELAEMESISEELADALAKLDESDIESLIKQLDEANNQLEAYQYMDDFVIVYNVGLDNKMYNTKVLVYGQANSENQYSHSIKKNDDVEWNTAVSSLKMEINGFISQNLSESDKEKYIYIIFSVNPKKVYQKDYQEIFEILSDFEDDYIDNNVRFIVKNIEEE